MSGWCSSSSATSATAVYEIDRIGKVIELESALDMFFLQLPFRDLFHAVLELAVLIKSAITGQRVTPENRFATANRAP